MKYDDLKFVPHPYLEGMLYAQLDLPNGYTVSIVDQEHGVLSTISMGRRYECGAWLTTLSGPMEDDNFMERRCKDGSEVEAWMKEIAVLDRRSGRGGPDEHGTPHRSSSPS